MRPLFHYTAARGWINDPHGITVRDGSYHSFYQYVPESLEWAPNCHWGHASGPDLLSLQEGPVALAPGDGDDGIWTGSLVVSDDGEARIFYTAVSTPDFGVGRVREARPIDADWTTWRKEDVIVRAPEDIDLIAFRDPFVFRDGAEWSMLVGAAGADGVARALRFSSLDLDSWTYRGAVAARDSRERDQVWMGALWECPQLVHFGESSVMITSVWDADVLHYAGYGAGRYQDGVFEADSWAQLSFGPSYYAPSFFRDAEGRACLSLWMRGVVDAAEGWAGAHSVPYLLAFDDGRLLASPHPDLLKYRSVIVPTGTSTPALAADIEWLPTDGCHLTATSGGAVALSLSIEGGSVVLAVGTEEWAMPYSAGVVRIILDGPLVEISAADGMLGAAIAPAGECFTVQGTGTFTTWALSRS